MTTKRPARKVRGPVKSVGECTIPPALPKSELHKLLFRHSENEALEVKEYVEWQAHGEEKVLHVEKVASELKSTADRAWKLVNWLTHAANATRSDADLALSATSHVVNNYALSVLRRKIDAPERCSRCKSYRIAVDWRPELGPTGLYVPRCEACGAEKLPAAPKKQRKMSVVPVKKANKE